MVWPWFCAETYWPEPLKLAWTVPETSTWAMLALGFAGLGFAGWRRVRRDQRSIEV